MDAKKPFGDDFAFVDAPFMFRNMDRLIAYLDGPERSSPRFRVRYATLSEYFALLHERIDVATVCPAVHRSLHPLFANPAH